MIQPIKRKKNKPKKASNKRSKALSTKRQYFTHDKVGTSKLEQDFATDFLDKLGLKYDWQYEARDIGRFYDYCVYTKSGSKVLIEVDGDWYHSNPSKVNENNLNPMQKHNKVVDKIKDNWALMRGIPLYRFWENDIRNNPNKVLNELKKIFNLEEKKKILLENKNKRHVNKIK